MRLAGLSLILAHACGGSKAPDPGLSADQIARYVRKDAKDPAAWAAAVRVALIKALQVPDADHACQVLAVIEQESGYAVDPEVPGLAKIVERELQAAVDDKLGFLGPKALELLLDVTPEGGTETFRQRLRTVKTERDLDGVFRDLVDHHEQKAPRLARALQILMPRLEERMNPISTAGSMQVNVGWAQEHDESFDVARDDVRDSLYTLEGGVLFGTLRLYAHDASYDSPVYRFADYNAGLYASRNAAFQDQVSALTGQPLTPDGDLIVWTRRGTPSDTDGQTLKALLLWRSQYQPDLPEQRLRRELKREKEGGFEDSDTWARVRTDYKQKTGRDPVYARIPEVALDSPKLEGDWSTKVFAERVARRHKDCLKRGR